MSEWREPNRSAIKVTLMIFLSLGGRTVAPSVSVVVADLWQEQAGRNS